VPMAARLCADGVQLPFSKSAMTSRGIGDGRINPRVPGAAIASSSRELRHCMADKSRRMARQSIMHSTLLVSSLLQLEERALCVF
jgi:hypothetical protein